MNDDKLCNALEGKGEILCNFPVFCVKRGGFLLLALPRDKEAAKATLKLYHPQALLARLLVKVVYWMILLGLHLFLPRRIICIRKKSPLTSMVKYSEKIGFLLGNPEAEARRAIILHDSESGYLVDKLGMGATARSSVVEELAIIQSLPQTHLGLPKVCGDRVEDTWASYTTPYLLGVAPKKSDQWVIIDLLNHWLIDAQPLNLGDTSQWKAMGDYVQKSKTDKVRVLWSKMAKASSLKIKVGLFHGDFAPWNIKIAPSGEVSVLDWEHGCADGPAGWDWLHFMIQRASLVDHLPVPEILEMCRQWATSTEGENFLTQAGWGDEVEFWLGSYLMYSLWIAGFDREELLRVWGDE